MNTWNTSRIYGTNEKISRLTRNTSRKLGAHQDANTKKSIMKHIKKHMNLIKTNKEHIKKTRNT